MHQQKSAQLSYLALSSAWKIRKPDANSLGAVGEVVCEGKGMKMSALLHSQRIRLLDSLPARDREKQLSWGNVMNEMKRL